MHNICSLNEDGSTEYCRTSKDRALIPMVSFYSCDAFGDIIYENDCFLIACSWIAGCCGDDNVLK